MTQDPRFPKSWCIFALLVCAAESDALVTEEEEIEVDALLLRARSLLSLSPTEVETFLASYREILKGANSVSPLALLACEKLVREPSLAESVYAHCVDLTLADRTLSFDERTFLAEVALNLGLSDKIASDIVRVLTWKNAT